MIFDVAIVGGGVVGCAVLRALTSAGFKCVLLEKENDVACGGASAGNSGIYHLGFGKIEGKIEKELFEVARQITRPEFERLGVPLKSCGALLVAFTAEEEAQLPKILAQSNSNGVIDSRLCTAEELFQMEPALSKDVRAGIHIPGETVVDSSMAVILMAHSARINGADVRTNCCVTKCQRGSDGLWQITTTDGSSSMTQITAKFLVNCAGLFADDLHEMTSQQGDKFKILPRKGEFLVYGESSKNLISHIIYPVPSKISRGVLVFPSIHGHVTVGPTAVDQLDKTDFTVDEQRRRDLEIYAQKVVPALTNHNVMTTYAGLRTATNSNDYLLKNYKDQQYVTCAGIRSTGFTCSLAIGQWVLAQISEQQSTLKSKVDEQKKREFSIIRAGDSVELDGFKYRLGHPLSRIGAPRH